MSNTASAYDAMLRRLFDLGIATQRQGYVYIDPAKLAAAPQDVQEQYSTTTGAPVSVGAPGASTDLGQYTGVIGVTDARGLHYEVWRSGQMVADVVGTPATDTVALMRQYGIGG